MNVEATTDAVDHHQLAPALERCEQTLGRHPGQVVADGDYTNHASVRRRRIAEWIFMDRGRRVGNPANAMPKAAAPRFWPAPSLMMPSGTASLARREKF